MIDILVSLLMIIVFSTLFVLTPFLIAYLRLSSGNSNNSFNYSNISTTNSNSSERELTDKEIELMKLSVLTNKGRELYYKSKEI
jgi:hypothetical protein